MVGIQEPLPVSRVINCIVPAGTNKREGLRCTKGPESPQERACWSQPTSAGRRGPGYLLLQEVQDQILQGLCPKIASLESNSC